MGSPILDQGRTVRISPRFEMLSYINTLMLQQILEKPEWAHKLTPRDFAALTPLIWEHVNPYGRFELDMNTRLPLQ